MQLLKDEYTPVKEEKQSFDNDDIQVEMIATLYRLRNGEITPTTAKQEIDILKSIKENCGSESSFINDWINAVFEADQEIA